jgi:hypothetical protein
MALQIGEIQKSVLTGLNRQAKSKQKSLPQSSISKIQENMTSAGKKNRTQNKPAKPAYAKFMENISNERFKGIKKVDTLI